MSADDKTPGQRLLLAAINCEHVISDGRIKLVRDPSQPGNALNQLSRRMEAALAAQPHPEGAMPLPAFQQRVSPWLHACFGPEISRDPVERNHRFLEEALELVQSLGCTQSEAYQLVDYVFGRLIGDPSQEVGGVMVTLAALCLANGLDMHEDGETELARIWTKVEAIRAKQAAKPKHSPLPVAIPAPAAAPAATPLADVNARSNLLKRLRHYGDADRDAACSLIEQLGADLYKAESRVGFLERSLASSSDCVGEWVKFGSNVADALGLRVMSPKSIIAEVDRLRASPPPAQNVQPLTTLLAHHAALLEESEYTYFELAYTRQTGWMAWITDKPGFETICVNPGRKVIAKGQGSTPEEAAADALAGIGAEPAGGA